MNIFFTTVLALTVVDRAIAFSSQLCVRQSHQRSNSLPGTSSSTYLEAHANNNNINNDSNKETGNWAPALTAAVVGWTMASQIALAAPLPTTTFAVAVTSTETAKNPMSTMFEQKPEPVYQKLDFSLPSYESAKSAVGFGEGTEVRNLGATTEASEKSEVDKQRDAMLKAEAARKERVQVAKKLAKMREAEDELRAQAKREEAARRMRGIFD